MFFNGLLSYLCLALKGLSLHAFITAYPVKKQLFTLSLSFSLLYCGNVHKAAPSVEALTY